MKSRGVRFPSALPREAIEDDFDHFKAAGPARQYNPWPELVDPDEPDRAWANPWVRLVYLPSTRPASLISGALREHQLSLRVGVLHEHVHLALGFTPAKELARALLGIAYSALDKLLDQPSDTWGRRTEENWRRLQVMNFTLEEAVSRIALAEELLATAFSFRAVELQLTEDDDRCRLVDYERRWVAAVSQWLPQFSALYFGGTEEATQGFRKLAALHTSPEAPFPLGGNLAVLGAFLETVDTERRGEGEFIDRCVPSESRCEELVAAVGAAHDLEDFKPWFVERARADLDAWEISLAVAAGASSFGKFPFADALWSLAHGDKPPRRRFRIFRRWQEHPREVARRVLEEDYDAWPVPDTDWAAVGWDQVLLYPREQTGQWYVTPHFVSQSSNRELPALLGYEAYRQQLNLGQGIRCPLLSNRGECECATDPEFKHKHLRLARWAQEGRFGPGKWSALPPPCGAGA